MGNPMSWSFAKNHGFWARRKMLIFVVWKIGNDRNMMGLKHIETIHWKRTQSREHLALLAMQALVKKKNLCEWFIKHIRYLAKDGFFADSTQNSSTDFDPPWNFLENRNRSSQTEELLRPWLVVFQCVFKKPPRDSCEIYSGHYSSL